MRKSLKSLWSAGAICAAFFVLNFNAHAQVPNIPGSLNERGSEEAAAIGATGMSVGDTRGRVQRGCDEEGYPSLSHCLADRHAPQYRFHPAERHYPAPVSWFLERVHLRFSHDDCLDASITPLGEVRAALLPTYSHEIIERQWSAWPPGYICKRTGSFMPSDRAHTTRDGFFLQIPNNDDEGATRRGVTPNNGVSPTKWEVYAHVAPRIEVATGRQLGWQVQYWLFFPYDAGPVTIDIPTPSPAGDVRTNIPSYVRPGHEGDWEVMAVDIGMLGHIERLWYKAHKTARPFITSRVTLANDAGDTGKYPDVASADYPHPVAYIGLSKHPHHPEAGTFDAPVGTKDYTADGGVVWNSQGSVVLLPERHEDMPDELRWTQYGGHWGEIGEFSDTSGPTGPAMKGDFCGMPINQERLLACRPECLPDVGRRDAWVIFYERPGFGGPREMHRASSRQDREKFLDFRSMDFNDRVSSIEWCLPEGDNYELFRDFDYEGERLTLPGRGRYGSVREMTIGLSEDFDNQASSGRFSFQRDRVRDNR